MTDSQKRFEDAMRISFVTLLGPHCFAMVLTDPLEYKHTEVAYAWIAWQAAEQQNAETSDKQEAVSEIAQDDVLDWLKPYKHWLDIGYGAKLYAPPPSKPVDTEPAAIYQEWIGSAWVDVEQEQYEGAATDKRRVVYTAPAAQSAEQAITKLATENGRLRAEIEKYQAVCAATYQCIGALEGPVRFLDALSDAANGSPGDAEGLLPVDSPAQSAAGDDVRDAERYRFLREQDDSCDVRPLRKHEYLEGVVSDRLMSPADLVRVTGMKTSSKQVQWFQDEFNVRVVRCSDGSPIVTWTTFEALLQKRAGLSSPNVEPIRPALRPLRSVR